MSAALCLPSISCGAFSAASALGRRSSCKGLVNPAIAPSCLPQACAGMCVGALRTILEPGKLLTHAVSTTACGCGTSWDAMTRWRALRTDTLVCACVVYFEVLVCRRPVFSPGEHAVCTHPREGVPVSHRSTPIWEQPPVARVFPASCFLPACRFLVGWARLSYCNNTTARCSEEDEGGSQLGMYCTYTL